MACMGGGGGVAGALGGGGAGCVSAGGAGSGLVGSAGSVGSDEAGGSMVLIECSNPEVRRQPVRIDGGGSCSGDTVASHLSARRSARAVAPRSVVEVAIEHA